jgi:iron complex outermembrane receptor protein
MDANGAAFIQGKRLFGVPKNGGNLWSTYTFYTGRLRDLKFGAGVLLRSQQEANNENTVRLPGYTLVNLMASYEWTMGSSTLIAQLNVDNLFDKKFFSAGGFGGGAFAGVPRMALGSLRWEW